MNKTNEDMTLYEVYPMLDSVQNLDGDTDILDNVSVSLYVPESLLEAQSVVELQRNWVQDSFYRLNVYFSEPFIISHRHVPSFSFDDFCSGVGGVLGLWAGASVLTILQIFSFLGNWMTKRKFKNTVKLQSAK